MSSKILDILRKYQVPLEQVGTRYKANCPLPKHLDNNPSFVVYPETESFYCFSCNRGGGALSFIMYMEGISRDEAQRKLEVDDPLTQIDKMFQPPEVQETDFNSPANFAISSLLRSKLQQGADWSTLGLFLQRLDRRLATEKLTESQAKELISEAQHLQ